MTKIIKKGDSYWCGDIEMEAVEDGTCMDCPIASICSKAYLNCTSLIGAMKFKLKENKMTETCKFFTIDNGDKQFRAKLWLEERNVCFQVLEQSGFPSEMGMDPNDRVCVEREPELEFSFVGIRGGDKTKDFETQSLLFQNNTDRDAYYAKACGWLQEFCDVNGKVEKFVNYDVEKTHVAIAMVKAYAMLARIEGMKADNLTRDPSEPLYGAEHFFAAESELDAIVREIWNQQPK